MKMFHALKRANSYRKVYKNWIDVISKVRKGEQQIPVILRTDKNNKGVCTLSCVRLLIALITEFNFDITKFYFEDGKIFYDGNLIVQYNVSFLSFFIKKGNEWYLPKYNLKFDERIGYPLFEVFIQNQYDTDVQGEVIDIGANIGDSAIYFAVKGASHVYAFEPLPSIYEVALRNVKLNNLEDKITLINAGVSSKDGKIKVPSSIRVKDSGVYSAISSKGDVEVPLISFQKVIEMAKDPYLLKMDCEGCEADIILNCNSLPFEKIFVESHPYITKVSHKRLISKLRELKYKCEERIKVGRAELFYCSKIF
ncbi:FkbM family methyltransferase [Acidianus brierleyi]|uniref:FkbM family methyltransferase n=2 Tax=Acidianus brierleyi TaxID=41673 RepID=A0A2U9ID70_9CREN|nr:FkbM family methyltransferase [Acidianus brierleyi]